LRYVRAWERHPASYSALVPNIACSYERAFHVAKVFDATEKCATGISTVARSFHAKAFHHPWINLRRRRYRFRNSRMQSAWRL
jgi:hypothetical protein